MINHLSWKQLLGEIVATWAIAGIISIFTGHMTLCLLVATLIVLVWHFMNLLRLSRWLWAEYSFFPPPGKGSWLPIFHGLHRMRRHQYQQRKRLASLISYFRRGAESLPDAVLLCQADGHLIWCNHKAQALTGLKWPQDKDQLILNLIRQPVFTNYFNQRHYQEPITLQLNGQRFIEFRLIYPYIDNTLLVMARDRTRTHHLETMRQQFFANVNHELRIPLTVLQGYIELLQNQTSNTPIEISAYTHMQAQVSRLVHLSTQITTLTRIETAPSTELSQNVDVSQIIRTLYDEFQSSRKQHQTVKLSVEPHLRVKGNEEQLRSAITNLFYNAVEHNPEDCHIDISWHQKNQTEATFTVKDDGIGIAPEHLSHLTERFYRADSSRSRQTGGSGLGLAIVKHVLNNHGSSLEIHSNQGQGSRFSFTMTAMGIN